MNAALKLMTPDDFLAWCLDQEDRWELVDGMPRMMTGATRIHDRVVVNVIVELGSQLKGKPCQPNTADVAARTPRGNVRRPDVTVDCAGPPDTALASQSPVVFIEVLSPSTRTIDMVRKTDEYKDVPSLRHILLIDPNLARVGHWYRADDATPWASEDITGLEAAVALSAVGVTLPMAAIYTGLDLKP